VQPPPHPPPQSCEGVDAVLAKARVRRNALADDTDGNATFVAEWNPDE